MIILNKDNWKLIKQTNQFWNEKIVYVSDLKLYNKSDYWASFDEIVLTFKGDCEDKATAKRHDLANEGIPGKYATCWTEKGGYHAVLVIHTDMGDMVLDNRHHDVKPARDLDYKWHKVEGEDGKWYELSL